MSGTTRPKFVLDNSGTTWFRNLSQNAELVRGFGPSSLGPESFTSPFCSEDKASEQVASDQKNRESFMAELAFEFIPEGEGKERSGLGEERQRKKKSRCCTGVSTGVERIGG